MTIEDSPGEIIFTTDTGQQATITRLEIDMAERTLGVRLAPNGQFQTEFEYREEQLQEFCGRLRSDSTITHQDMETIYTFRWSVWYWCV